MVFRRTNRLRPINTLKHVIDNQQVIAAGTAVDVSLIEGTENAVSTVAIENDVGSRVNSIYLNIQIIASTDAVGLVQNAYMFVFGNPGGNIAAVSIPAVNAVGISDFRKQIFHQEMRMLSDTADSIPSSLFNGVIKIPKKFQRIGIDDEIRVRIGSPSGGPEITACVQCVYKEIR